MGGFGVYLKRTVVTSPLYTFAGVHCAPDVEDDALPWRFREGSRVSRRLSISSWTQMLLPLLATMKIMPALAGGVGAGVGSHCSLNV